jgi:adenosine deaminase
VRTTPPAAGCRQTNTAVKDYFDLVRSAPPELVELVRLFPKGGDIHNHLSGSIMPEDFIEIGTGDRSCYGPDSHNPAWFAIHPYSGETGDCLPGDVPLALTSPTDREKLLRSLSMYQFSYPDIQSGHDQFFDTFSRFAAVSNPDRNVAPMLVKLLKQAFRENVSYVETMVSFRSSAVLNLANLLSRQFPDPAMFRDNRNYPAMYAALQSAGLQDLVAVAGHDIARYDQQVKTLLGCGTARQDPACDVVYAFQTTVNRNSSLPDKSADLPKIFAQTAFSALLALNELRVVGVNLLSGEDLSVSMDNFATEMAFFSYFHDRFPTVNIALHGGEITPCFVGTGNQALKSHLTGPVRAGAKRLGHAVSFTYLAKEDQEEVAALMKRNNTLVEILFTSNAQILGVTGEEHPFMDYFRKYGVPVALATDDGGVSYTDYTTAWLYAIVQYRLTYDEAVRLGRSSIQYSFLPGAPLWSDMGGAKIVPPCAGLEPGGAVAGGSACAEFLQGNIKADRQWDYESKLGRFEKENGRSFRQYLGSPRSPASNP